MSGTHLFYNGVLMRDCEMKQWRQEIVRDESGTDVLYSKVLLSAESTLISLYNPSAPQGGQSPAGGQSAPLSTIAIPVVTTETVVDRWHEIQWRLQETRKDFWLALNGTTGYAVAAGAVPANDGENNASYRIVLAATGLSAEDLRDLQENPDADLGFIEAFNDFGSGTPRTKIERNKVIDLNNGPKPLHVVVEKVMGGRALRVSLTIEICRCFCRPVPSTGDPDDVQPPTLGTGKVEGVISNRWSLTETTDAQWKTEHTIDGKLVVADARYKPHAMKLMVHPLLFPYAKLESRQFTTDRTGLALAYRFQIKEAGPAAPAIAVDWDGTYTERAVGGGKKLADIGVRVTGKVNPVAGAHTSDPGKEHKSQLMAIAFRIAKSRVRFSTKFLGVPGVESQDFVLLDAVIVEHISKPIVELRVAVMYHDKGNDNQIVSDNLGLRLENMGASLSSEFDNYDPRWWPMPTTYPWDVESQKDKAGESGDGTYFDTYYQSPCSQWHAMPQAALPSELVNRDTAAGATPPPPTDLSQVRALSIAIDPTMSANLYDANDPPPGVPITSAAHGWNADQALFSYIRADIDTVYDFGSGGVQLPLSKARDNFGSLQETSVTVQLHAGVAQRVITMIASRLGKWPQVPEPKPIINPGTGGIVEKLLSGKAVNNAPKLTDDGKTLIYSTEIRWVYALSRVPRKDLNDSFRAASNPMDKTTPAGNKIALTDYFNNGVVETG